MSYTMGSSRMIDGKLFSLLTTAPNEESAKETVTVFRHWLQKGSEVIYIEDNGTYLVYARNAPTPRIS